MREISADDFRADLVKFRKPPSTTADDDGRLRPSEPVGSTDTEGAKVLDEMLAVMCRYCVLPTSHHAVACVLWAAATHCIEAFDVAPRLVVRSPEMRSGKTRLVEIVAGLSHRPMVTSTISDAVLYRTIDPANPRTIFVDEADTLFGHAVGRSREALRGIIDAGFQRGTVVPRMTGAHTIKAHEFEPFAMVALAGLGRMPSTIEDRAIVVPMKRRRGDEPVVAFRRTRDLPELEEIAARLEAWAAKRLDDLRTAEPDLPVDDRAADVWYSLLAVADAAGGDWPERARAACVALSAEHEGDVSDTSLNLQALHDIAQVWEMTGAKFLSSADLCDAMQALPESRWESVTLNPSKLGWLLKPFEVRTGFNDERTRRGYRPEMFTDALRRYLPDLREE